MAKGLGNINPKSGNRDSLKMEELVKVFSLPKEASGEWQNLRFLPTDVISVAIHWVTIITPKEKKEINIPKLCLAHNPDDESTPTGKVCPYCELDDKLGGRAGVAYFTNAIVRDIQESEPKKVQKPSSKEKKSGHIQMGSDTWTPVRVIRLPNGLAGKISKIAQRNFEKGKKGKTHPVDHEEFGIDLAIQYDKDASASDAYSIDKGDRSPLSKTEKKYLTWDLSADLLEKIGLESEEEAKKEFKKLDFPGADTLGSDESDLSGDDSDDSDDDSDDDMKLGKSKKSSKKSKSKKKSKRDGSDDSDDSDDDEPKKKKKKSSSKSKSKSKSSSKDKKESSSKDKKSSSKSKSSSKDKKKKKKKASF